MIPAQTFKVPGAEPDRDLRRKSARAPRKARGSQTTLPHSCILPDNIPEGDILFNSGGFANVWKDSNALMNASDNAGDAVEPSSGFKEMDLISFLNGCKDKPKGDYDTKEAQMIVDMLDRVRLFWNQLCQVT